MKKHFYFDREEQLKIISTYNLYCSFDIGPKTYVIKVVDDDSNCMIILVYKDNGKIMQKWVCFKNDDYICSFKNDDYISCENIDCDINNFMSCLEIVDNNNVKCFLCEKKLD
jgi:hypothetical protein